MWHEEEGNGNNKKAAASRIFIRNSDSIEAFVVADKNYLQQPCGTSKAGLKA